MSYGATALYRLVLKQKLTSYTSCFRLFQTDAVKNLQLSDYGFCGVSEILVRLDMQDKHFVEYPAVLGTREYGQSKINTLKTIRDHLQLLGKVILAKWFARPLRNLDLPRLSHGK